MKTAFDFKTLAEFLEAFKDEETCHEHFVKIRFAKGEYCAHCNHNEIYRFANGKRFRCAKCKQDFTIRTNTVFGESKIPLRKWFIAIYLLTSNRKGISSVELAEKVGVTQKTGWFIDHRLREAMKQNGGQLFGRIEADETYIGGKVPNMSKTRRKKFAGMTGGAGKIPLVGILQRGGEIQVKVADAVNRQTLLPNIMQNVQKGSFVYTDENVCYRGLHKLGFIHNSVQHQTREYVVGDCHTNSIESFWALFKRKYHGVHHWMSKKHLQRYVDEATFRFNHRANPIHRIFTNTIERIAESPKLPYKVLTQKIA